MLRAYQRDLVISYVVNTVKRLDKRDPEAADLMSWVIENAALLKLDTRQKAPPRRTRRDQASDAADSGLTEGSWEEFRETLCHEAQTTSKRRPDLTARRLRHLAEITGISPTDIRILEVLLLYETEPVVESMIDEVFRSGHRRSRFNMRNSPLPNLLDLPPHAVSVRLRPTAPLLRSGLVSVDNDGDLSLPGRLNRLALVPGNELEVKDLLLGKPDPAELEWSDFDHVTHDRDHVEKLVKGALAVGEAGVNILLYGPPGTGKTQFCRTLAERLGIALFGAGETDDNGGEPNRAERLSDLILAQALLARERNSLLLFDEMVDLLPDRNGPFFSGRGHQDAGSSGSKLFMNQLLETVPVPTLWIANTSDNIPAVLVRRMKFALEFRLPPPRIRARIWSRQLARNGIAAGPQEALSLAEDFAAPPGVAAEVTAAARLSGGDIASVRRGLHGLARALSCEMPAQRPPASFDLDLLQSDADLSELAQRLACGNERRFSLCLQGPPGTGKSACVRYLAARLGLEVVQKRTSDLLSPWVGETEQNIAAAFREARDDEAFLVFDEADSLLADRRYAVRNWEVSQTNEMLTWMESHPLPFACTTNFSDHLDIATLRRFIFKVSLDYLSRKQTASAFRAFFDQDPPEEVFLLSTLTPGDFAVVRRKAQILGRMGEPKRLAVLLREECDAKPEHRRPIGFLR